MSSCQLALSIEAPRVPLHVSLSTSGDLLAVLHHLGRLQLWDLRTNMELKRGKAIDPILVCEVSLGSDIPCLQPRQILVEGSLHAAFRVICLASSSVSDVIFEINGAGKDVLERHEMSLPGARGRLVHSSLQVYWQDDSGSIYKGERIFC